MAALNKSQVREYPKRPLIHHSDRGIQYGCDDYGSLLQRSRIKNQHDTVRIAL